MPRTVSLKSRSGFAYSSRPLASAPPARPAGFQYVAVASSATAVKAPAIPCARTPIASVVWAPALVAMNNDSEKDPKAQAKNAEAKRDTTSRETVNMSPSVSVFLCVL